MVAQQLVVRAANGVCGLRLEQPGGNQPRQLAEPTETLIRRENLAGAVFLFGRLSPTRVTRSVRVELSSGDGLSDVTSLMMSPLTVKWCFISGRQLGSTGSNLLEQQNFRS